MFSREQLARIAAFRRHPAATREEVLAFQRGCLVDVVRHAAETVPRYRETFKNHGVSIEDIRCVTDLPQLPTFDRQDVKGRPRSELLASGARAKDLVPHTTSGSSGEPFTLWHGHWELQMIRLLTMRAFRSFGWRRSDRMVRVWRTSARHRQDPLRKKLTDRLGFYRRDEVAWPQPGPAIVEALLGYQPSVLRGNASAIRVVLRTLEEQQEHRVRPKFVILDGEVVAPCLRQQARDILGARVFDVYVCTELALLGWECKGCGRILTCDDGLVLEVLREDGQPAQPGETGEAVVTGLHSYAMPIIRYRTGDLVVKGEDGCPCGLPFGTLARPVGRLGDAFLLPEGKRIHPRLVSDTFEDLPWIWAFRLSQEQEDLLTIRLVLRGNIPGETARKDVRERARGALPPEVRVEVLVVDDLPPEVNGKLKRYQPLKSLSMGAWGTV